MPTTTGTNVLTYPAQGATGWNATMVTLFQNLTTYIDDNDLTISGNTVTQHASHTLNIQNIDVTSSGAINWESGSTLEVENGATVTLGSAIDLTLGASATLTIPSGSTLAVASGATTTIGNTPTLSSGGGLTAQSGSTVTAQSGSTVDIQSGATCKLDATITGTSNTVDVGADWNPSADETWDLGSITAAWQDLFAKRVSFNDGTDYLDTYETGTFTPTMAGSTASGTVGYTYQVGHYTVIGNVCHVSISIKWTSHTGTGDLLLNGLPKTSKNVTNLVQTFAIWETGIGPHIIYPELDPNTTQLKFYQDDGSQQAVDSAATFHITGTYLIE